MNGVGYVIAAYIGAALLYGVYLSWLLRAGARASEEEEP